MDLIGAKGFSVILKGINTELRKAFLKFIYNANNISKLQNVLRKLYSPEFVEQELFAIFNRWISALPSYTDEYYPVPKTTPKVSGVLPITIRTETAARRRLDVLRAQEAAYEAQQALSRKKRDAAKQLVQDIRRCREEAVKLRSAKKKQAELLVEQITSMRNQVKEARVSVQKEKRKTGENLFLLYTTL
ncbi:unnamed protein product [Echinostoma caproni]|uniref:CH_2 domain-containing protein n=1 Tax=Echinostoma caproni TaxID=27848 RepID=A0A183AWL9_9TREM|nr:unnamed protein product [Echinostoma caproni]